MGGEFGSFGFPFCRSRPKGCELFAEREDQIGVLGLGIGEALPPVGDLLAQRQERVIRSALQRDRLFRTRNQRFPPQEFFRADLADNRRCWCRRGL